jgi:tetratricopeptide (TPR) repeat protein
MGVESVDIITRVLRAEFPELDAERLRGAVEKAIARVASSRLDTEGYQVVDLHLAKVEASEESEERSKILRELSETLEGRNDAERALVVRLSAFSEVASQDDVGPILRLARITERYAELPLEAMSALVDLNHDDAVSNLTGLATAFQHVARPYYAADCLERVLVIDPAHVKAFETLEAFYRSTSEWPVLADLIGRRVLHVNNKKEQAELYRQIGIIYDRHLGDPEAALDAYRESDGLVSGKADVLEGIARLSVELGVPEDEALSAAERFGNVVVDPKQRAAALCKAADLAKLQDWDKAQRLYEEARTADPDNVAAVDGLAGMLRDRGQLSEAVTMLVNAAERIESERSRWLVDAADFCVALGDTDWAKQLYRDARTADPTNYRAGVALVELGWSASSPDGGDPGELAAILDQLCKTTDDPTRLRGYLIQRSKLASQVGEMTNARNLLARAVEIDPEDIASRRELANMLYEAQQWAKARPLMEHLLIDEDLLAPGIAPELHYRAARCARELGDVEGAAQHVDVALVLAPDHREALVLRTELGKADPLQQVADQLALASTAPPEERATRFAMIGDRYIDLGDRAAAREMYREALAHRPGDHLLLTKFLELVADDGDWSYSLDVLQRLIETEKEPKVRARYRHLAGMIARDELDYFDRAVGFFREALVDDPMSFAAADELEALLDTGDDREALASYYYQRLEAVRANEGRPGERLRLWDHLGELLIELNRHGDAVVAFEVALSLDPENLDRRKRLADFYGTDTKHDPAAITQHQAILRASKRHLESYKALRQLYARSHQDEKAEALQEAIDVLSQKSVDESAHVGLSKEPRTLSNDDWNVLSRIDVDLQLSALFAVVGPPFAVDRARMRPPAAVPSKEHELPFNVSKVINRVVQAFAIDRASGTRPPVYLDRDQVASAKLLMRLRDGVLVPVLVLGRPVIDKQIGDHELAFHLGRQLCDLRTDRIARLLCPRAGELAQVIEIAMTPPGDNTSHAARWLMSTLHPVEVEQVRALGGRLRDRQLHPATAATNWLAATERAADRLAFVIAGDLPRCANIIEREPDADANRVLELVWSSVTEEVLAVRGRVEGWANVPPPIPTRASQVTLA